MNSKDKKGWAEFYNAKINIYDIYAHIGNQWALIKRIKKLPQGASLLEIGVGTGITACYLSNIGYKVTAIDNDIQVLNKAKKFIERFNSRITLIGMDMFNLDFSGKFDLVYHQGVLEHYSEGEIQTAIEEQFKVTNKIIFSVPSYNYPRKDFGNENLWNIKKWKEVLRKFKIVEIFGYDFIYSNRFFLFFPKVNCKIETNAIWICDKEVLKRTKNGS